MRRTALLVLLLGAFGCHGAPPPGSPAVGPTGTAANTSVPSGGGGAGGVTPMGSGIGGGITPMAGTDSVEGAGMGGLGNSAKDAARRAASQSSAPSGTTETGE